MNHHWSAPDVRGWAAIGMFALVFYVVSLAAFIPALSGNELFKTIAILILGTGGFGLLCAFLWGGSKASVHAAEAVSDIARAASASPPGGSATATFTVTEPKP